MSRAREAPAHQSAVARHQSVARGGRVAPVAEAGVSRATFDRYFPEGRDAVLRLLDELCPLT